MPWSMHSSNPTSARTHSSRNRRNRSLRPAGAASTYAVTLGSSCTARTLASARSHEPTMKRLAAMLALVVAAAGCSATAHSATPTGLSILQQKASYDVYRKSTVSQLEAREKAACKLIASSSDVQSGITAAG